MNGLTSKSTKRQLRYRSLSREKGQREIKSETTPTRIEWTCGAGLLFRACRPRYGWLVSVTASSLRDGRLITTISLPSPQRRESWWFSRGGGCTTTTRPKKPRPIDRPSSVRHARTPVSDVTSVRFFPGFPLVLRTTLFRVWVLTRLHPALGEKEKKTEGTPVELGRARPN
jgi:hypothetical protein